MSSTAYAPLEVEPSTPVHGIDTNIEESDGVAIDLTAVAPAADQIVIKVRYVQGLFMYRDRMRISILHSQCHG